jgi:hypothetical protein
LNRLIGKQAIKPGFTEDYMKNLQIALAILGVAHGILAIEAKAADPYEPLPEPAYEAPNYAFTGLGVGVDGGGQFTAIQLNDGPVSFDGISADGLVGGGHLEYLVAVDRFRLGAFCDGGLSNVNTDIETSGPSGDLLSMDHYYGCYGKVGATVYGDSLVAIHFGYQWSQWTVGDAFGADIQADAGFWVIGPSIETMIDPNWSVGLVGDYGFLDNVEAEGMDLTPVFDETEFGRIKVRLTYRN